MNRLLDIVKEKLNIIKVFKTPSSSLVFLRAVITLSFLPVVLLVGTWCYTFYFHIEEQWVFTMMDYAIKIIDHIWSAQLVAGVMAYGTALVDSDGDGVPDKWEGGNS